MRRHRPLLPILLAAVLLLGVAGPAAAAGGLKRIRPAAGQLQNAAAPGTSIRPTQSQQVMVADRTSGVVGTYVRYEWRGPSSGWVQVGSASARFGYNGMSNPNTRREGDGTTPTGSYRIVDTFGIGNPGTKMHYRTINTCSWWSWRRDATYNRFVQQCGFGDGEHLTDYTTNTDKQYLQTAVLDFLWNRQSEHRGSAIFLHYSNPNNGRNGYTAGCVGLTSRTELTATIRWLDPAKNPTIVILA